MHLFNQCIKVGVNDKRRFHLLLMILKEKFVFAFFGHLNLCWPAVHTFAIFFVVHKDVGSCEPGQAHHAKVFCVAVFALIKKQCVYSFYIAIVLLFAFFIQHKVYSFHVCFFLADSVHNNGFSFAPQACRLVLPMLGNRCLCNLCHLQLDICLVFKHLSHLLVETRQL